MPMSEDQGEALLVATLAKVTELGERLVAAQEKQAEALMTLAKLYHHAQFSPQVTVPPTHGA